MPGGLLKWVHPFPVIWKITQTLPTAAGCSYLAAAPCYWSCFRRERGSLVACQSKELKRRKDGIKNFKIQDEAAMYGNFISLRKNNIYEKHHFKFNVLHFPLSWYTCHISFSTRYRTFCQHLNTGFICYVLLKLDKCPCPICPHSSCSPNFLFCFNGHISAWCL